MRNHPGCRFWQDALIPPVIVGLLLLFFFLSFFFFFLLLSLLLQKKFYGPHKRKMLFMGLIRVGVWQNFLRAWKNGFSGNLEGEGVILGGVYVMGAGKQVLKGSLGALSWFSTT